MKKIFLGLFFLLAAQGAAHSAPNKLPGFILPDPQGNKHNSSQLVSQGLVVIISSPVLKDKSAQEGWVKYLVATKGSNPARLILIEDLTETEFKGVVEDHLKKDWKPGTLPLILEDKTGKVHAVFGVGEDQTMVFAYDPDRKLVYSTTAPPSPDGAKKVWEKLKK